MNPNPTNKFGGYAPRRPGNSHRQTPPPPHRNVGKKKNARFFHAKLIENKQVNKISPRETNLGKIQENSQILNQLNSAKGNKLAR
jgi:hypothetical protein